MPVLSSCGGSYSVWNLFFSSVQNCSFDVFFFFPRFDKVYLDLGRSYVKQIFWPQNSYQIKYQMAKSTLNRFWEGIWQTFLWFTLGHPEVLGYSKKNNQQDQIFFFFLSVRGQSSWVKISSPESICSGKYQCEIRMNYITCPVWYHHLLLQWKAETVLE